MDLPDLKQYRANFKKKGVKLPLNVITAGKDGLLGTIPPPPAAKTGWPWTEQTNPSVYADRATWPKITIVTPSFNQGAFIEQTIRSVLLQNYPALEYIIMDGGSTDNTREILDKYSPWISFLQSEKDNGQGHAINRGFSLASGVYYAWLNSDDYYLPDAFYKVSGKFLSSNTEFIYGYGFSYHIKREWFELITVLPFLDVFIKLPSLIQPSTFWKSSIHQPIWEELHCALDFELWMRLVKGKRRERIKEPLSVANIHDNAKTSDISMKAKWDEDEKKMWSINGHGGVPHWHKINRINRIRIRLYKLLGLS